MGKKIIVGDIDGCVINSEHRIPHLLAGDRDMYHSLWGLDTPMPVGIEVYKKFLDDPEYTFLFITGRMEAARDFTLLQLKRFIDGRIINDQLLMRPDHLTGDDMPDHLLKPSLVKQHGYRLQDVFLVFEDRDSTVKGWRDLGIPCYQCQPGNF